MKSRKRYTSEFKSKVALEAIRGDQTLAELAAKHELHPNLISKWKQQAIEGMSRVFDDKPAADPKASHETEVAKLHTKIGQLVVERDFVAKAFGR